MYILAYIISHFPLSSQPDTVLDFSFSIPYNIRISCSFSPILSKSEVFFLKKIILCLLLLVLSGCSFTQDQTASSELSLPSPAPSQWGAPIEQVSHAETTTAPSSTPAPTPTPTPEPSFTDLHSPGPVVHLQYQDAETQPLSGNESPYLEVESVLIDGNTYIKYSDLQSVYPWLDSAQETDEGLCFPTLYGSVTAPMASSVTFQGQTLENLDSSSIYIPEEDDLWIPLHRVCDATGLYILWDAQEYLVYVSQKLDMSLIPQGKAIPTLMYHEVGDALWGISDLFVSPDNMRQQLQYLQEGGFDPIFFSDLTHLADYDNPVMLTFDDGYIGNYTELFPLLQEFNMKATIFVIPDLLDTPNYMTREQVREMADSGLVSIQSHTMSHPELATISQQEQDYELSQSQLEITRITGRIPYVLCYPSGSHNDTTVALGQQYYQFGLKMNGGLWITDQDYFEIDRFYVSRTTTIGSFSSFVE